MDLSRVLLDVIYVALEIMDLCVVLTLILSSGDFGFALEIMDVCVSCLMLILGIVHCSR